MACAQRAQSGGQFFRQCERDEIAGVILNRRARVIGRKFEQRRRAAQMLGPEIDLPLQFVTGQVPSLPCGKIGVLDFEGRQRVGKAGTECVI